MVNHGCINGTLEGADYSSPVPVIGLYIAAASLVCMVMMLYDIVFGLRAQQRWLPCKSFTLNSFTLTLLSIAAKLPVDLTTSMPRPEDQLSKLSGTAFICITMGFLLPSLGTGTESEGFTNLVSFSIFAITVVVNICIQISTRVIVVFIAEHIIIMFSMLLLLVLLWFSFWDSHQRKKLNFGFDRDVFADGSGSMYEHLEKSYLSSYQNDPQFLLATHPVYFASGIICSISSAILIVSALRSLVLKQLEFCSGDSDYGWSMPAIIATQILTVVVGIFGVTFRWLALFKYINMQSLTETMNQEAADEIEDNPILGVVVSVLGKNGRYVWKLYLKMVVGVQYMLTILPFMVLGFILRCADRNLETDSQVWKARKSSEDMKRWLETNKNESSSQLYQLLSPAYPSDRIDGMYLGSVYVTSLSVVLLARIGQVCLAGDRSENLVQSFKAAKETINFIDKTVNSNHKEIPMRKKWWYAEAVWAGNDFSCLLEKIFETSTHDPLQSDLDRAVFIITNLPMVLPMDSTWHDLYGIVTFLQERRYSSIEDFYNAFLQMFVDMLHIMLAQLPDAIFKFLSDSPPEDYGERVKLALKLVYQIEPIEDKFTWSFPEGCGYRRLITLDDTQSQNGSANEDIC